MSNDRSDDCLAQTEAPSLCSTLSGFKGIGTYEWRVDEDRVLWSPELMAIYGVDRAPDTERGFSDRVHPEDRTRVEAETSSFMGEGDAYEHEFRIVRPDGEVRVVHDRGLIERSENGAVRRMRGINIDITELRQSQLQAEADLRESEARLQLAYDVADISAWDLDLRERRSVWSGGLYSLLGLEEADTASDELFFQHVHPDDEHRLRACFDEAIESRTTFDEVFRVVRTDGEVRAVVGKGRVIEELDGEPARMIGVNYDVTERIQALEQNHLLMQEVNHRFKNVLSLTQAIARQTMLTRPEDFLDRFTARIQALAAAQDMLVHNRWSGVRLDALVRSQLAHMEDLIDRRIRLSGPRLKINADAAQALGMAVHELATNAGKHGALSNDAGQVEISWRLQTNASNEQEFVVSWIERDGPPVKKPDSLGFGTIVIDRMTSTTFGGMVEVDYAPEGLSWHLRCPADCIATEKAGSSGA